MASPLSRLLRTQSWLAVMTSTMIFSTPFTILKFTEAVSTCPTDSESQICSGHGACSTDSTCSCFANWDYTADCSQRTCPSGVAWFDKATADNVAHAETECSNAGTCNRNTGECQCFDGFEGNACQRTSCECSGHGFCKSIADLADAHAGISYTNWEASVLQLCYCDNGYTGYDCSQRMCPKGDDYKTSGQTYRQIEVDIQPDDASDTLSGTVTLHFGKYKVTFDGNQDSIDCQTDILDPLDNIYSSNCSVTSGSGGGATYLITLLAFPAQPKQNNLFYHDGDVTADDFFCNIDRLKTTGSNPGSCTVTSVNPDDDVYEYAYCGNSGICDFSDGVCTCFDGFTGVACGSLLEVVATGSSDPVLSIESKSLAYTGDVLELKSYKSASSDYNFFTATDGDNIQVFSVDGEGAVTAATSVTSLTVSTNSISVSDGGLVVSSSATSLTSPDAATSPLAVAATSTSFGGDAISATVSNTASPETFNFLNFYDSATASKFSVRGDGLVIATDVNVNYLTVLTELSVDGDVDVTGDGAMRSLSLLEDVSSTATVLDISTTVSGYTGTVAAISSSTENTDSITLLQLSNSDGPVLEVKGDGATTLHTGGLLVDAGGLEVSAGGLTVVSGGAAIDGGLTVVDGGTTLNATSGEALSVSGLASITSDLSATSPLTISATSGSFSNSAVLKVTHALSSGADDIDFLRGVGDGVELFNIDGKGNFETSGEVKATTFGITAQNDGDRPTCDNSRRGEFYLNTDSTDDKLYICVLVSGSMSWREATLTAI